MPDPAATRAPRGLASAEAPPAWPAGDREVVLAAVAGAHGVRGEVRLKRFTAAPEGLSRHAWLWAGGRPLRLLSLRPGPHGEVVRLGGIETRDAAEALRGLELAVPRSALAPPDAGEVYAVDLIGRTVLADGLPVGRVAGVENYGAGDLVEIEQPDGARRLIPFARCELATDGLEIDPAFLA